MHRLDKDTSGLIILAKNDHAHQWLQNQFKQRRVEKVYLALVDGQPPTPTGRIEAPIERDPAHRKRMAVVPPGKGREAITEYFTKEGFLRHTLLKVHPITGRTHQIRVHMAFLGAQLLGIRFMDTRNLLFQLNGIFCMQLSLQFACLVSKRNHL